MFGRFDAHEFADSNHLDNVEQIIKRLRERHDMLGGEIYTEFSYAIYPQVEKFALEYLDILRGIPKLPYFLVNFGPDEFHFHWKIKDKIDLRTLLSWDEQDGYSVVYMEMDMDHQRNLKYIVEEVPLVDRGKIMDRLNSPQFTYGS